MNARWHQFNAWPQCGECNVEKGGNLKKYEKKLIDLYGQDAVDAIYHLSYTPSSLTDDDLKQLAKKYKQLTD